jgi:hypothetical protein
LTNGWIGKGGVGVGVVVVGVVVVVVVVVVVGAGGSQPFRKVGSPLGQFLPGYIW